jgi:hypothetical protein
MGFAVGFVDGSLLMLSNVGMNMTVVVYPHSFACVCPILPRYPRFDPVFIYILSAGIQIVVVFLP